MIAMSWSIDSLSGEYPSCAIISIAKRDCPLGSQFNLSYVPATTSK